MPLWQSSLAYSPFALYAAGFAPGAANFEQVQRDAGSPDRIRREDVQALSFWMVFFGAARGDRMRLEVTGPDGRIIAERDIVQEKDRARQFYFVGKRVKPDHLPAGVYSGRATLVRDGGNVLKGEIVKRVTLE